MKKLTSFILLTFLFATTLRAQTRVLAGIDGGSSFGNFFIGPSIALEVPVVKRFELDLKDNFAPIEEHIALGRGWANLAKGGGIIWLTKTIGLNGSAEYSNYHVSISKAAEYGFSGITIRRKIDDSPIRLSFDYLRQFNNGITRNGTESSHLQAGEFNFDARITCTGPFCYRLALDYMIGHVLTQGDPYCDGTFSSAITCPRTGASSGSFKGSFYLEFPRHRGHENDSF